jgi:hypothetical protein
MRNKSEIRPLRAPPRTGRLAARLLRAAYLGAVLTAMIGWSIALGWGSFSLLRWFL